MTQQNEEPKEQGTEGERIGVVEGVDPADYVGVSPDQQGHALEYEQPQWSDEEREQLGLDNRPEPKNDDEDKSAAGLIAPEPPADDGGDDDDNEEKGSEEDSEEGPEDSSPAKLSTPSL